MQVSRVELAYQREGPKMLRALTAYAGSREIAEDAVAEAFARALQHDGRIRDVSPWVWRVAFRVASAEVSRRMSPIPSTLDGGIEVDGSTADLIRALTGLSPKQRAAVLLHHYAGHPVRDVAAIVGSTPAAVRVHLSTGRGRLRKALGVDDE